MRKLIEWWQVENTGWTNGVSWFRTGGSDTNPLRLNSEQEAIDLISKARVQWDDPAVKWRYVHVTVEREDNKIVTTEVWTEL